jgi:hypothetical protein
MCNTKRRKWTTGVPYDWGKYLTFYQCAAWCKILPSWPLTVSHVLSIKPPSVDRTNKCDTSRLHESTNISVSKSVPSFSPLSLVTACVLRSLITEHNMNPKLTDTHRSNERLDSWKAAVWNLKPSFSAVKLWDFVMVCRMVQRPPTDRSAVRDLINVYNLRFTNMLPIGCFIVI